jgi:hypothetical protein
MFLLDFGGLKVETGEKVSLSKHALVKQDLIFSLCVHPCDRHMGPLLLQPSLFLTLFGCCRLRPRDGPSASFPPVQPAHRCFQSTGTPRGHTYVVFDFRSHDPSQKQTPFCSGASLKCLETPLLIAPGLAGQTHMYKDAAS